MTSRSSTTTTTSTPPVTLPASTHLDPRAYVRGHHGITLGEQTVIHPRAHLIAIHGPVVIGDRCIIYENCVIGGPVPSVSTAAVSTSTSGASPALPSSASAGILRPNNGDENDQDEPNKDDNDKDDDDDDDEADPVKTVIGSNVHLHANVHVLAGARIGDAAIVEANVTIQKDVTIEAHSKVTPGVVVDRNVPDWTVVLSDGRWRSRKPMTLGGIDVEVTSSRDGKNSAELVEQVRLKAMDKERDGSGVVLRTAQRHASSTRRK
ncbi:hypothetical protein B0A52_00412 [Exophiala mesophila]|uniref:Dynactin subunit 6 n=1 Tax=Exophiala mesophila TaxID=212818 RepID=A0A438NK12_EXOME|nr:hypothetical protein B0A52_00412 [Exophiala mesophila]